MDKEKLELAIDTLKKAESPYYYDLDSQMIFSKDGKMLVDIRGWAWIQKLKNDPKERQDAIGELLVTFINKLLAEDRNDNIEAILKKHKPHIQKPTMMSFEDLFNEVAEGLFGNEKKQINSDFDYFQKITLAAMGVSKEELDKAAEPVKKKRLLTSAMVGPRRFDVEEFVNKSDIEVVSIVGDYPTLTVFYYHN